VLSFEFTPKVQVQKYPQLCLKRFTDKLSQKENELKDESN